MAYIFRRKFDIRELAAPVQQAKRVLIAEPEEYLRALYAHHLSDEDFFVKPCADAEALAGHIVAFIPDVLVINACLHGTAASTARYLRQLCSRHPSLLVVTLGFGDSPEEVKHLMATGVSAHLDRKFSKPRDIVEIIRTLVY